MSCITRNNKDQITGVVLNNGKDSKLFDDLLKIHQNGTIAYNIYQQILSPAFQSIKHEYELDSNGEPVLKNKYTTSNNIESYLVKPNITTSPNTDQIIEGDIWTSNGIPIITTNLGGIHGAGLANQAYTKGYIKYKQDGDFGDRNKVITFPVKKIWSDKTDLELLKDSAEKLIELAKQNPTKKYSLPLIGLGHGEGKIEEIVPVIKHILNSTNNVKLVLPTSNTDTGKKGTARTDRSLENIDQIKKLLQEQPTKQEETKSGVSELFESNPELANQVYETLGFTGEKTIETAKGSTYRYLSSGKTQRFKKVEGKEYEPQDILTFVPNYEWIKSNNPQWLEKQGLENDTQYTQYLLEKVQGKDKVWIVDSKGKKIETNQDAKIADRLFIAFGKKDGTVEDFIPVSKEPVIGFYTYDSRIHFDEKGERYRDRHLGNKVVKITEDITPQQKATAQQLYSQYLDSLNTTELYSKLGNKTESDNVKIVKDIFANKGNKDIITAFRVDKKIGLLESFRKYNAIGNPIDWKGFKHRFEGDNATIAFMDWFLGKDYTNLEQEYRQEILNNLDNLKGKFIEYYKELGRPSHATALDYLLNQLGSKQDIGGFKKFVSKETKKVDKDLNQKLQNILQKLYPEIKLNITNNPIWEQGDNIFNQEEYNNQVNYRLKATEKVLDNLSKIKQWESNKSIDQNTLWGKIGELGISKQQLELLRESEGNTIEEKLASFVTSYSYTVEINTAKENIKVPTANYPNVNSIFIEGKEYKKIGENSYTLNNNTIDYNDLPKSAKEYLDTINVKELKEPQPTQYYSNLTVPGGTNYTENEISTPLITPSIKGHAQFSTDNGIGWFRSDEQVEGGKYEKGKIDRVSPDGTLITNIIGEPTKTRRILEVQSDVFQKSREYKSPDEIIQRLQKEGKLKIKCD